MDAPTPPIATAPINAGPSSNPSSSGSAAVSVLLAATGGIVGAIFYGAWGAASGVLLGGAVRNAWRAKSDWSNPEEAARNEAAKSATMAAIGFAAGTYLAYQAYNSRKGKE